MLMRYVFTNNFCGSVQDIFQWKSDENQGIVIGFIPPVVC